MNKKTIVNALLALVSITGQGLSASQSAIELRA